MSVELSSADSVATVDSTDGSAGGGDRPAGSKRGRDVRGRVGSACPVTSAGDGKRVDSAVVEEPWWDTLSWLAVMYCLLALRSPVAGERHYKAKRALTIVMRVVAFVSLGLVTYSEAYIFCLRDGFKPANLVLIFVPGVWLLTMAVTCLMWSKQRELDRALAAIPRHRLRSMGSSIFITSLIPLALASTSFLTSSWLVNVLPMAFAFSAIRALMLPISLKRWEVDQLAQRLLREGHADRLAAQQLLRGLLILRQEVRSISDGLAIVLMPQVGGSAMFCIAFALAGLSGRLEVDVAVTFSIIFSLEALIPLSAGALLTDALHLVVNNWLHAGGPAAVTMQEEKDALLASVLTTRPSTDAFLLGRTPVTIGLVFNAAYTLVVALLFVVQREAGGLT